jgi:hypothetical protein
MRWHRALLSAALQVGGVPIQENLGHGRTRDDAHWTAPLSAHDQKGFRASFGEGPDHVCEFGRLLDEGYPARDIGGDEHAFELIFAPKLKNELQQNNAVVAFRTFDDKCLRRGASELLEQRLKPRLCGNEVGPSHQLTGVS